MQKISEKKMHRSSRMRYLWITLLMLLAGSGVTLAGLLDGNVAKVGNTEYATIEEAIAAWGPGKTLTLLKDVTTTSTVTVEVTRSSGNWILELGDYTWTASGCNAFNLYATGGTAIDQNVGLKVYANQNGGVTASGKYAFQCTDDGVNVGDKGYRARLDIYGGTYNANYVIYYKTSAYSSTRNGASVTLNKSADGTEPIFNGNFGLSKCPVTVNAGYFNGTKFTVYRVTSTVDPRLFGGHFKTYSAFPVPGNNKGISFGNYKVFVKSDASIDVINGAPATFEAKATKTLLLSTNQSVNYSDYVYYEKADDAINKYSSGTIEIFLSEGVTATANKSFSSGTLTIDASAAGSAYTGTITLAGNNAKFITRFPEGGGHYGVNVRQGQLHVEESTTDGVVTRIYTVTNAVAEADAVAKIGNTYYKTIFDAFYAVDGTEGKTITLLKDVSDAGFVTNGKAVNGTGKTDVTFDLNGHSIGFTNAGVGKDADYTLTVIDSDPDKKGVVTNSLATFTTLALENMINLTGQYDMKIQAGTWQFDPSSISFNGETRNLVDEGYYARDNGNGTWTVGELPAVAKIGDVKYRTLDAAVAAANEGDLIEVLIADTYTLPNLPKNVTVQGNVEGVVFNHTGNGNVAAIPNGATFKNVSFNFGNNNYHGFQHAGTINMEGCTLNGKFFSYADMNFTNCEFKHAGDYNMWVYGAGNVVYDQCTFTNSTTGKLLNLYCEGADLTHKVTVKDCKFVNGSSLSKAAINVKATSGSNLLQYELHLEGNNTFEGNFPTEQGEQDNKDHTFILSQLAQVDDRTADGIDNITVWEGEKLIYPVTYVAQIEGGKKYATLTEALAAATDGQTVKLLADIDGTKEDMSGGTRQFVISKSITLDGDGHTVTTKNRGFGVGMNATSKIGVTFKNVIILNTTSGARCIDTRGNINSLTLDGVTLNTNGASGTTQPLTIGGNQADAATINITNSTIQTNDDATAYYAIITFNPVNMTIEGSTIKGWANIYAKGVDGSAGSAGSVFTINNSTLVSSNAYSGVSNAFAAFMVEDNNVTVNVTNSDVTIENTGDQIQAIGGAKANLENVNVNLGEGNKVKFVEPGTYAMDLNSAHVIVSGGIFSESVPEENCAEGMIPTDNTDEATKAEYPYAVKVGAYVAQYAGNKYETLQAALDAAEAVDDKNMVIDLLADATLDITAWSGTTNALSIGTENTESITINGNNHKLTFNQKNSDWNNVATMNDAQTKLILNDMAITNSGHNNGPWNRHDINFSCDVTLNNVTSDKALAFKNSATLNDVTITDQPGSVYGIWISPRVEGQTVNINGLNLTAERGIKIDDQYVARDGSTVQLATLNIQNATFNTTKKAAILVKSAGGAVINAGEGIDISNAKADGQNLVWVDEASATEYYKVTTNGATMKPESKEEDYVASLRHGDQIRGYYKTFAAAYASSDYQTGDFYQLHKTTTESVSVDKELTIIKNGYTADNVTAAAGFQREETLKKIVISPAVIENPATIADGYYRIKNLGNGNYVNVLGRRTATVNTSEADTKALAGTVIKVNAPDGKVETLRSQAVDIPHYAERAMTYVPEFVEMVVQKLGVEGSGEVLGTTGVDAIMQKFNESFDYHLHTEVAGEGAVRIYGKTPRMKPVVEFYEENKDKVDAKLPQLEQAVNTAIDKVVDKMGRGESLRNSFSLHQVWERMGKTLTEPNDEASKVKFLQEVLMDEAYVWDFGYQAVMIYVEKVENSSFFNEMPAELKKYWNLAKQTRPGFKYYIVQKDGKMDIISEGNIDILNDNARTKWVLEEAENFDIDFAVTNSNGESFATIYTDFGYELPSGVTALKVTGIDANGMAQTEEIGQYVAAQTPVLLKSTTGSGTKTLTIGNFGTSVSGNLLHGADWVINEYDITSSSVASLFTFVAMASPSVADKYDYLTSLNSGTVGNKYFFPVTLDQLSTAYKAKTGNEMNETPVHYLGVAEDGKVAFVRSWETIAANAVYMFDETVENIYLDKPEFPADIAEGYYRIKNLGNDSYVNVRGRKTATVNASEADTETLAGTVLKVKATDGVVEILRSQAVDLPRYAQRAMSYVPDVVELVVSKLGVEGSGEILGTTGVDAIMQKFNESFDANLHVEYLNAENTDELRIYGKTPSMKPVVEFYQENKANVDYKLPQLESAINEAIAKVVNKAGMGTSLLNSFNLETIWERMGSTLTRPADDATKVQFLKEVLANETNVWNFAYQTATFYMEKVEGSSYFNQIPEEYKKYWNLAKQVRPNFKYYIVQKDGKMDFISEGNIDLISENARTKWVVEPVTEFTVNVPETNSRLVGKDKKEYYTTLYTDFGYQLPEGVTALKVTEIKDVQELGLAVTEEIGREVAAQTPVLIKSETAGDITLTIGDNYGSKVTDNLLHGADWLINEYEINTPALEGLFDLFKEKISASTADKYEYLLRRNSGTVNNKYFFPLSSDDIIKAYSAKSGSNETPIRMLGKNGKFLAFHDSWDDLPSNAVFLFSEDYKPVFLYLIGDVDRDGDIDIDDVNATIDIVLGRDKPENNYDYEAADVDEAYEDIDINDTNTLIDLVLHRISLKSLIEKILAQ